MTVFSQDTYMLSTQNNIHLEVDETSKASGHAPTAPGFQFFDHRLN